MEYSLNRFLSFGFNSAAVYFLNLTKSNLELKGVEDDLTIVNRKENNVNWTDSIPIYPSNDYLSNPVRNCFVKNKLVVNNLVCYMPLHRSLDVSPYSICIGVLVLVSKKKKSNLNWIHDLHDHANCIFSYLYNQNYIINLLRNSNKRIHQKNSLDEFLVKVVELLSCSSTFPYVVLREYDESGDLNVLKTYGFSTDDLVEDFDKTNRPSIFNRVLKYKVPQVSKSKDLDNFNCVKKYKLQKFIALPIIIMEKVFGIVTLSTPCLHEFTELEVEALELLAQSIGTSINNFNLSNQGNFTSAELNKLASAITVNEIAQSARHTIIGLMLKSNTLLMDLIDEYQNLEQPLERLGEINSDILDELQNIRFATKPPSLKLEVFELKEIIEQAIETVAGRLNKLRVDFKIGNFRTVHISGHKDRLRHVFLNLILNSADAFESFSKKRGREIDFTFNAIKKNKIIKITYSDNAGGIDPTKLRDLLEPDRVLDESVKINLNSLLFKPHISSKINTGSGFGLFLVREILSHPDHKGNINLINYRNGVTFEILLPYVN